MLRKNRARGSDQVKVTFVLPEGETNGNVSVVGEFNNWRPGVNQFVRRSNNTCSTAVMLNAGGRFAFRYLSEDGTWFNDEAADAYEPNEHGGENCIVET